MQVTAEIGELSDSRQMVIATRLDQIANSDPDSGTRCEGSQCPVEIAGTVGADGGEERGSRAGERACPCPPRDPRPKVSAYHRRRSVDPGGAWKPGSAGRARRRLRSMFFSERWFSTRLPFVAIVGAKAAACPLADPRGRCALERTGHQTPCWPCAPPGLPDTAMPTAVGRPQSGTPTCWTVAASFGAMLAARHLPARWSCGWSRGLAAAHHIHLESVPRRPRGPLGDHREGRGYHANQSQRRPLERHRSDLRLPSRGASHASLRASRSGRSNTLADRL